LGGQDTGATIDAWTVLGMALILLCVAMINGYNNIT